MFPIISIIFNNGDLLNQFRSSYVPELNETLFIDNNVYKVIHKYTHVINGNFEIQIVIE